MHDLMGQRFGKLVVLRQVDSVRKFGRRWLCLCDCGGQSIVIASNLLKGNSTSCGCKRKHSCAIRMATLNYKHGQSDTRLFRVWKGILERTTNKNSDAYKNYGGRGISMHPTWAADFSLFAAYVGQPPNEESTIDRWPDNDGNYEPGNVRWATPKQQATNRRTNLWVEVNGHKMILADAARFLSISKSTASRWLASGKLKLSSKDAAPEERRS